MPIPPDFFPYLADMRALAKDREGRDILVGLTFGETEEYLRLSDDAQLDRMSAADRSAATDRYLELSEKHEAHRLAVVMAESEARRDPSRRH